MDMSFPEYLVIPSYGKLKAQVKTGHAVEISTCTTNFKRVSYQGRTPEFVEEIYTVHTTKNNDLFHVIWTPEPLTIPAPLVEQTLDSFIGNIGSANLYQ
jgi:hypothetical protein